jgi:hypothetical protein
MASSSSRYFVASVICAEAELPILQQVLQTFPAVNGAVTHDRGKARYCLNLEGLTAVQAKLLIEQIQNTISLVLSQLRDSEEK